jgi:Zn-dependent peptidase ImmA (M78 family)
MKAYSVAVLLLQTLPDGVSATRLSQHIREAVSEEEALGMAYKYLYEHFKDYMVVQMIVMPVFKEDGENLNA